MRYAVKGEKGDQGTVRGNRYGISRNVQVIESTVDVMDREEAAEALHALTAKVSESEGVEPLGSLWLTRHGLAFPVGTTDELVSSVIERLGAGELPS